MMLVIFLFFVCFSYAFPVDSQASTSRAPILPPALAPRYGTREYKYYYWPNTRRSMPNCHPDLVPETTPAIFFADIRDPRQRAEISAVDDVEVGHIISVGVDNLPDGPPKDKGQKVWRLIIYDIHEPVHEHFDPQPIYRAFIFKPAPPRPMFSSPKPPPNGWELNTNLFPSSGQQGRPVFKGAAVHVYTAQTWAFLKARLIHGRANATEVKNITNSNSMHRSPYEFPNRTERPPVYLKKDPLPSYTPTRSRAT